MSFHEQAYKKLEDDSIQFIGKKKQTKQQQQQKNTKQNQSKKMTPNTHTQQNYLY